ncbi:MAG TPA: VOC family protein [Acidimicrobiales bacterium]|nr:VOC family protein [Acidimicrobiales bacterium]
MDDTIRIGSISLDCDDPAALGAFWASLLDGEVAFSSDNFVAVRTDVVWLSAVRVDNYRAPTWPDDDVAKQVHLDLAVKDLGAATVRAERLGARKHEVQPQPDRWIVMSDPAGHPFCLSTQIPD